MTLVREFCHYGRWFGNIIGRRDRGLQYTGVFDSSEGYRKAVTNYVWNARYITFGDAFTPSEKVPILTERRNDWPQGHSERNVWDSYLPLAVIVSRCQFFILAVTILLLKWTVCFSYNFTRIQTHSVLQYVQGVLFMTHPKQQLLSKVQKWSKKPFLECEGASQIPSSLQYVLFWLLDPLSGSSWCVPEQDVINISFFTKTKFFTDSYMLFAMTLIYCSHRLIVNL
jgi:hypothetical protein